MGFKNKFLINLIKGTLLAVIGFYMCKEATDLSLQGIQAVSSWRGERPVFLRFLFGLFVHSLGQFYVLKALLLKYLPQAILNKVDRDIFDVLFGEEKQDI